MEGCRKVHNGASAPLIRYRRKLRSRQGPPPWPPNGALSLIQTSVVMPVAFLNFFLFTQFPQLSDWSRVLIFSSFTYGLPSAPRPDDLTA